MSSLREERVKEIKKKRDGESERRWNYDVHTIRAPNCCCRVTGDYFLIAAIKRRRSARIGACIGRVWCPCWSKVVATRFVRETDRENVKQKGGFQTRADSKLIRDADWLSRNTVKGPSSGPEEAEYHYLLCSTFPRFRFVVDFTLRVICILYARYAVPAPALPPYRWQIYSTILLAAFRRRISSFRLPRPRRNRRFRCLKAICFNEIFSCRIA